MGTPILTIVFAGLVGGILWNLVTWLLGLPSSSSHALFGGLIGAAIAALGLSGVKWDGVISSIVIPALAAPVVAGLVAAVGTRLIFAIVAKVPEERRDKRLPLGPDRLGVAGLAGPRHQRRAEDDGRHHPGADRLRQLDRRPGHPVLGEGRLRRGHRRRHLPRRLAGDPHPGQGPGRDQPRRRAWRPRPASAAIILSSSHLGMALSTTQVATGSILGPGWAARARGPLGRRRPDGGRLGDHPAGRRSRRRAVLVRGRPDRRCRRGRLVFAILVAAPRRCTAAPARTPINHDNVNAEWQGGLVPADQPHRVNAAEEEHRMEILVKASRTLAGPGRRPAARRRSARPVRPRRPFPERAGPWWWGWADGGRLTSQQGPAARRWPVPSASAFGPGGVFGIVVIVFGKQLFGS